MDAPKQHPESIVVSAGRPHEPGGPVNTPIVPAAPYRHDGADNRYARHDVSPTVASFEAVLGELEGGDALAFASGIGALATVVDTLPVGSVVVVPAEAYSGTVATFREGETAGRFAVRRVDTGSPDEVAAACAGAALVWV